jgi:hypothetical protein
VRLLFREAVVSARSLTGVKEAQRNKGTGSRTQQKPPWLLINVRSQIVARNYKAKTRTSDIYCSEVFVFRLFVINA